MGKRGSYKARDPEGVKQALLDAVGDILREQGHAGLGVNKVGQRAQVNKGLIYWYYTSYNNLLKTYIRGRDLWGAIFARFRREAPLAQGDMPEYIIAIFREQFRVFSEDREMQKLILWQASESNSLLNEISQEREDAGARIVALTDAHFVGSKVDFRSVLALVLGGIYYTVWHASNNSSTVVGVDINKERDRLKFERAIGQVIRAVWGYARFDLEHVGEDGKEENARVLGDVEGIDRIENAGQVSSADAGNTRNEGKC